MECTRGNLLLCVISCYSLTRLKAIGVGVGLGWVWGSERETVGKRVEEKSRAEVRLDSFIAISVHDAGQLSAGR